MLRSLQSRLGVSLGILLLVLWAAAATMTALRVRSEINQVFDSALQETAQRILPLAVADILERDDAGVTRRLAEFNTHDELITYLVRDAQGRILLRSHDADPAHFPAWNGNGFRQTGTHRLYNESTLQGSLRITVAEPLRHRQAMAQDVQISLGLPILIFIPVALLAIALAVRSSLAPLRQFRNKLAKRDEHDLSLLPIEDLPAEIAPVADTLNDLLGRLEAAFTAERNFAANAAHELRTPLAGAIAQVQRLHAETGETDTRQRAQDIERTLKRLTALSERLLQLARAEGGQLCRSQHADLRPVARLLTADLSRILKTERIMLQLPEQPLLSCLDPDIFAILYRNLVENALRHGTAGTPVLVRLTHDGTLSVRNQSPVVAGAVLRQLTERFQRGGASNSGNGLGLAIVHAISQRIGSPLQLSSPIAGHVDGFEAKITVPVSDQS